MPTIKVHPARYVVPAAKASAKRGAAKAAKPRQTAPKSPTRRPRKAAAPNGPLSELYGLSECWFQAWLERDAATVGRLAADDYIYVAPNGAALDRLAVLAIIRSPSYRLDYGTRSEVVVRALGHNAAVVRHRYQGAGSFEGTSFTDDHRCLMIWEKLAGNWRLVMEQCSFSSK